MTPLAIRYPVRMVVVGASAGGIEALGVLLPCVPRDATAPVVCVVHLPQEGSSGLARLFLAKCAVPVREAVDKEPARAGTIYFAPPGYHLLLETEGTFALSVDDPVNYARPSIDVLFESAARAYGAGLLGVLLSGANDDGARGLHAVHEAGGRAWVQEPSEAPASAMPLAGLRVAHPDRVLRVGEMGRELRKLLREERECGKKPTS